MNIGFLLTFLTGLSFGAFLLTLIVFLFFSWLGIIFPMWILNVTGGLAGLFFLMLLVYFVDQYKKEIKERKELWK